MTLISPAQPRPAPSHSLHPGLQRTHSRSASQLPQAIVKEDRQSVQEGDFDVLDDRPTKRRKTSTSTAHSLSSQSGSAIPARYQAAPWSTVVRISAEQQASHGADVALPPLPERPWGTVVSTENVLQDIRPPVRVRKNVVVPNTPDSIEKPEDAPLFERQKLADYFPWTGRHPEDVLNEVHVKQGYFDRPPNPPDKELNTAKPPLYNAFKHRSGLESLSALFSLVLDAKSKHAAFSSTSSFKGPPPRVTLTEAKRKSWISDLANPEVPLRKLSKTIPQGIRGASLLEQCLLHNIPLSRAIWFTKCVGANEIRTLKRKGVNPAVAQGAEIKWLREWTLNVEQFLESVFGQNTLSKAKDKIRYSIVLAARLYLENLLDRDHYLDWILKSFSVAKINHWPFWLTMIHLHRKDLVAFRKNGKRLAESLVLKYNATLAAPGAVHPLAQHFAAALRPLINAKPNCFLIPDKWAECLAALTSCLDSKNDDDRQILDHLKFTNVRALGGIKQSGLATTSPLEQVVEILDSFRASTSAMDLYDALSQTCSDPECLMQECLQWCTSKYRTGRTRVYLCARLFRKLRKQGHDVDKVLLDFIFAHQASNTVDTNSLKHLVSELSRSQFFPASKYMQWLSVRGLPHSGSTSEYVLPIKLDGTAESIQIQECKDSQQLLTEICLSHTESHLINLRNSLLNRAGFDEDAELATIENLRTFIRRSLTGFDSGSNKHFWRQIRFNRIPWATKTSLSYWLRTETIALAKASQIEIPGKPPLPGARSLTLGRFQILRGILEAMDDIAILADILRIASSSRQEDVLAAAVDTINMHSLTLSSIGALEPLQILYAQTYVMLRSVKPAMPLYATALINLCEQYPTKTAPVRALQQDFIRGDRGRAVTACSPFSDGVAESLQQAGATFHDDFEAILQTESNMTDQNMVQLFKVLVDRIEKTQHMVDGAHELFISCQLLARLKSCQKAQGDLLVKRWVARLCTNAGQPMGSRLLFSLICTQCVPLEVILEASQQQSTGSNFQARLYDHIRRAMLDDLEEGLDESMLYGFKLAVSRLSTTRPVDLLDVIGTDESGRSSTTSTKAVSIAAVLNNPELMKMLSKPAWLIVSQTLSEQLSDLNTSDTPELQARALATSAGPLSLPFCSLRMRMLCQNTATKNDESIQENIANMLCAVAADPSSSLSQSPRTFQTLLRATGPVVSAKVRSNIEQSFFNALPRFLQSKSLTQPPVPTQEETENAATALQQVILVSTDAAPPQVVAVNGLIEKLTIYMKTLGPSSSAVSQSTASSPVATSAPAFPLGDQPHSFLLASLDHLKFLLQLMCIKRSMSNVSASTTAPNAARTSQQDQIKLVGLLISIGTHPTWSTVLTALADRAQQAKIHAMINFTFDVAATLVDDMSDESRTFCARILKDKVKDERVQWLLGSVNTFGSSQSQDIGHGYQVVHDSKGVLGEWKPKTWEMLESGGGDSCLGLGLFGARTA